jgi:hypothetical protein
MEEDRKKKRIFLGIFQFKGWLRVLICTAVCETIKHKYGGLYSDFMVFTVRRSNTQHVREHASQPSPTSPRSRCPMWILHTCGKKYLQESDVVMIRDASTMVEQHDQVKIFF